MTKENVEKLEGEQNWKLVFVDAKYRIGPLHFFMICICHRFTQINEKKTVSL